MTQKFILFFLFLLAIACNGQGIDFTNETENCLCNCGKPVYDLMKELDKRLSVTMEEVRRLVSLHNTFQSFKRENSVEHKEMRNIINKLSRQLNSNKNPTSESLILSPEAIISTSTPIMADEATKMTENFTTLIEDKFKEVNSLSSEVTELQQENKVLKEKIEEEKRVRRSLQHQVYFVEERLNQTESWVLEINEKVKENSTVDEVAEIIFAKIAEFDVLNKTAIESQLKKLEYTVKDAFKNETQLAQRLDSVENASAYTVGLLGNGTLVDQVHNIASTIQTLENLQSQQSDFVSHLDLQLIEVNTSFARKLQKVEYTVAVMDLSINETMTYFENELSKLNDTWSEKSVVIDKTFADVDDQIRDVTGRTLNSTKDMKVVLRSFYTEVQNNITIVQDEIEKAQIKLEGIVQLPDELTSIKSVLNQTVEKDELYSLWNNVTEQSKFLEERAFDFYTNLSGIINSTKEKVDAMESKYSDENLLFKQSLSNFSTQEQRAEERLDSLQLELKTLMQNQTLGISVLQSRLENLSSKVEETDQEKEHALSAMVYNISKLHDLQMESDHTIRQSFEAMEKLFAQKIDFHKEEINSLRNHLETIINSTAETVTDGDESFLSRARVDLSKISTEASTEAPELCLYIPLTSASELVVAYLNEDVYEEVFQETWIPHGEQLFFSCKEIGKSVLVGARALTCVNGQWSDVFPQCQKLLRESVIRDASRDQADPCLEPRGQFPDPSDCRYYYNCWDDTKKREKCHNGLHFNAETRKCDYVHSANCTVQQTTKKVDQLEDITPPIDFSPLAVDVANSLLSASITGELVVYPGVNLNMICLYPRKLGEPQWEIVENLSHPHIPPGDPKGISDLKDFYKLQLSIPSITEDHSGNYTCITPKERKHTIRILVKAVTCPEFEVDPGHQVSVFYRPNPEGLQRVMTTQASFNCPLGYSVNGSDTAICKASGRWSHDLPTCQKEEIIGCSKPDLQSEPELYVYPDESVYSIGDPIYFKCKSQRSLLGITTARCNSGGVWTIIGGPLTESDLPTCY